MSNLTFKKHVVIIDDDALLRNTFEIIVNSSEKFIVTGSYPNFEEGYKGIQLNRPQIVLMDIELPGINGIEGVKIIKDQYPGIDLIMLTVHEDDEMVFAALKAGAVGYIVKGVSHMEFFGALDELVKGGAPMSSKIARMVVSNYHLTLNSPLSERERRILSMLAANKTYAQIAEELVISKETSKKHVRNIYSKLHVHSKSEAVEKANREKLI